MGKAQWWNITIRLTDGPPLALPARGCRCFVHTTAARRWSVYWPAWRVTPEPCRDCRPRGAAVAADEGALRGLWLYRLPWLARLLRVVVATGCCHSGRRSGLDDRTHFCQRLVQGAEQEVVDIAPVPEPDFIFRRVNIDVHQRRIQRQVKNKNRVPPVIEHIPVGLAYGMGYQSVFYHAAIDVKVLPVGLGAGKGGQSHPAPEMKAGDLPFDKDGIVEKVGAEQRCDAGLLTCARINRTQLVAVCAGCGANESLCRSCPSATRRKTSSR